MLFSLQYLIRVRSISSFSWSTIFLCFLKTLKKYICWCLEILTYLGMPFVNYSWYNILNCFSLVWWIVFCFSLSFWKNIPWHWFRRQTWNISQSNNNYINWTLTTSVPIILPINCFPSLVLNCFRWVLNRYDFLLALSSIHPFIHSPLQMEPTQFPCLN